MRLHRIGIVGHRGKGGGQFEQRHPRRAERQAGIGAQRAGHAQIARGADHLFAADAFLQPHRRHVARPRERLAQRDVAAIGLVAVGGRPAVDRQPFVRNAIVRGQARAQRRQIDEQLERRSRLPPRLRRAVEPAVLVIAPADHRHDLAVRPHRHQRDLRPAQRRAVHRPDRRALHPVVQRGLHRLFGIERARAVARLRHRPVGEIGAGRQASHAAHVQPGGAHTPRGGGIDEAAILHRRHHQRLPRACAGQIGCGRQPRRRLHQPGQHRRFADVQPLGPLVEIMPGGRAQPVHIVAEIDVGQIARQDLVLGQPRFQPEGDEHLAHLARGGPVRIEERHLGQLLRDRAAALAHAARLHIMPRRARDALRIDAQMAAEPAILDRHERLADMIGQRGDVHRRRDHRAAPGDRLAARGQQCHAGRRDRAERFRQRRGDRQPADQQHEQQRRPARDPPPAQPARPPPPPRRDRRQDMRGGIIGGWRHRPRRAIASEGIVGIERGQVHGGVL